MLRRGVLGGVAAAVAMPALAQLTAASPAGSYDVEGEIGNRPYRGTVTVEQAGQPFVVRWNVGGVAFTGIGIVEGGSFVVGYSGNESVGVVTLTRSPDGAWSGHWTAMGNPLIGVERWTPRR
jgi:hypothetical protein